MSFPITPLNETQGWKAELNLGFKRISGKTVLASRSQSGPLTVQRPFYPEESVCHLYLLHPPGGVVGGDELHINVALNDNANTLITTPGATKFYRNTGRLAHQIQTLYVAHECALEWFPQENIFFDQTHTHLFTRIELEGSARFMGWEINCYGRPASNETFDNGFVSTRLELYRDNKPILLDGLVVNDGNNALNSPNCMNGYACFGTFIATHVTQDLLDKARQVVSAHSNEAGMMLGMTLMDDILVARCLGQYAEQISTTLKTIWSVLRPEVLGRDACQPRIWST